MVERSISLKLVHFCYLDLYIFKTSFSKSLLKVFDKALFEIFVIHSLPLTGARLDPYPAPFFHMIIYCKLGTSSTALVPDIRKGPVPDVHHIQPKPLIHIHILLQKKNALGSVLAFRSTHFFVHYK